MIDDMDRRLLRYYQAESELPMADLAERVGVTAATCWRRLEKLRGDGVIKAEESAINWAALGYSVEVSLRFTLDKAQPRAFDDFLEAARQVPEVLEIQTFLGQVDVRLALIARDLAHYQQVYRDRILNLPHIADIEALMHIARVKNEAGVPL